MTPEDFLHVADAFADAALLVSGDGKILAANAAVRTLGIDRRAVVGRTLWKLAATPRGDLERFLRESARGRAPVPGSLVLSDSETPCRCYGSLVVPARAGSSAQLILRLVPRSGSVRQFNALNEKIDQLTREIHRRQQAEAELRRQREQLEITLSSIGDAVIVTDAAGNVHNMNPVAESLTGWQMQDACGQPLTTVFNIVNEYSRQKVENPVETAIATGKIQGLANHTMLIARDGSERPISDSAAPILAADGAIVGVVLIFRDVSNQRQWLRQLQDSERRFRSVVQSDMIGIGFWDTGGALTDANQRLLDMIGYSHREVEAGLVRWSDLTPREYEETDQRALAEMRRNGFCRPYEKECIRKDGSRFPILIGGSHFEGDPRHGSFWVLDITERKRTERDLRFLADASRSLATLVDDRSTLQRVAQLAVPGFADWCVIHLADSDDRLRQVAAAHTNPARIHLAIELDRRYPPRGDTAGAGRVYRTGQAEMEQEISSEVLQVAAQDPEHFKMLTELGLKSYLSVPLSVRDRPFGVITFVAAESSRRYTRADLDVAQDLAHRAAISIENGRLYRELQEADRRKDEFLAMLAHELRNPLAPIRSGLDILSIDGVQPDIVDLMKHQVEHLVRLVDDLLDVSRILRGKIELRRETVDLGSVMARAVDAVRPLIESRQQQFVSRLPANPVRLDADPVRLAQVVSNLLTNASKYTDPGGHIWLTAGRDRDTISIEVSDDGVGIEERLLPHVFDLFIQSERSIDRSQGGLGIGLTVVKNLVEMHGGHVSAYSGGMGKGSTFTVELPGTTTERVDTTTKPRGVAASSKRVLIVDDNTAAAQLLSRLLASMGEYQIETAHDGEAALFAAEAFGPDLILLDIGLPKLDGFEVARRLRQRPKFTDLLIVAVTGYGTLEDRGRSEQAGFDEHLVKPLTRDDLQQVLMHPKLAHS